MSNNYTWRKGYEDESSNRDDTSSIVSVYPNFDVLDIEFDDGFGCAEGPPFLLWTENYVYFPVQYDGSEFIGSAPRNPCNIAQFHVGGG